jgi:hypothetical protein
MGERERKKEYMNILTAENKKEGKQRSYKTKGDMKTFIINKGRSKIVKDIGEHDKGERKNVDKEERTRFDLSLSTYNKRNSVVCLQFLVSFLLVSMVYMLVNCLQAESVC